eukprot:c19182_g1_i2.p1 GENE.c19182_g1_i2~~c19182_g1_i2.p1  ORF type:complete len:210 (+),score=44.48 c19182_g1_i2:50-679(+)
MESLYTSVNFYEKSFVYAAFSIFLAPAIWNVVARLEFHYKLFTRLTGDKYIACYALAAWVFFTSLYRDYLFYEAMTKQQKLEWLGSIYLTVLSYMLCGFGNVLVLSSMYKLGVTGTYHGDHFGIFKKERVTSFPFNVLQNPMYDGATMIFLSGAIWAQSPAGLMLTAWVFICYRVALWVESPFTAYIYAEKARRDSENKKESAVYKKKN